MTDKNCIVRRVIELQSPEYQLIFCYSVKSAILVPSSPMITDIDDENFKVVGFQENLEVVGDQKMVGEFILRCLMLIFGYAYPALKCYKTLEKNKVDMEELRFWCKYWVIVAILTVFERTGDIFISWLPFYGDMKLAFVIYLWHPKTKGTNNVYDGLLTPYVANHETDIEQKLLEWKTRALDLAIFYGRDCSQLGHTAFLQVLQFLASQTSKFTNDDTKRNEKQDPILSPSYRKSAEEENEASKKQAGYEVYTTIPETEQFDDVEGDVHSEMDQVNSENELPVSPQNHLNQKNNEARLRRSKAGI